MRDKIVVFGEFKNTESSDVQVDIVRPHTWNFLVSKLTTAAMSLFFYMLFRILTLEEGIIILFPQQMITIIICRDKHLLDY